MLRITNLSADKLFPHTSNRDYLDILVDLHLGSSLIRTSFVEFHGNWAAIGTYNPKRNEEKDELTSRLYFSDGNQPFQSRKIDGHIVTSAIPVVYKEGGVSYEPFIAIGSTPRGVNFIGSFQGELRRIPIYRRLFQSDDILCGAEFQFHPDHGISVMGYRVGDTNVDRRDRYKTPFACWDFAAIADHMDVDYEKTFALLSHHKSVSTTFYRLSQGVGRPQKNLKRPSRYQIPVVHA